MNSRTADFDKFQKQPELWVNSRMVTADVPLVREKVSKLLPFGMWLTEEPMGTLFIVDYVQPNFSAPYCEAALLVHVKTAFGKGLHCCWITVDDDTALIYGRELLGYPKKMAEFEFEEKDETVTASVTRRGKRVLSMTANIKTRQDLPEPVFDRKFFNAGGLGNFLAFQLVWLSRSKERIQESYNADVEIGLEESTSDPIAKLIKPGQVSRGRFVVFDIIRGKYLLPVGMVGPAWFGRTQNLRVR